MGFAGRGRRKFAVSPLKAGCPHPANIKPVRVRVRGVQPASPLQAGCPHPAQSLFPAAWGHEDYRGSFRSPGSRLGPEGATGESPGWNPGDRATQHPLCPERAHETAAYGPRSPRWGEGSWGGVTQGSAPLHPGLSPCAALRRGRERDACPGACVPKGTTADFRCQSAEVTTLNQDVTCSCLGRYLQWRVAYATRHCKSTLETGPFPRPFASGRRICDVRMQIAALRHAARSGFSQRPNPLSWFQVHSSVSRGPTPGAILASRRVGHAAYKGSFQSPDPRSPKRIGRILRLPPLGKDSGRRCPHRLRNGSGTATRTSPPRCMAGAVSRCAQRTVSAGVTSTIPAAGIRRGL
jgi:hypothetical protein